MGGAVHNRADASLGWASRQCSSSLLVAGGVPDRRSVQAAAGSAVSGTAWADTNRDGVRDPGEPTRPGLAVKLLSSPGGAVVASTTTAANGTYSSADVGDGDYFVRVDAPTAFKFPAASGVDNDFARTGDPVPGDPERGGSALFTIAGATKVTGLDAGLQPIADLKVVKMEWSDACEGFTRTGTPQWPLAFHDKLPEFPNAVITSCAAFGFYDGGRIRSCETVGGNGDGVEDSGRCCQAHTREPRHRRRLLASATTPISTANQGVVPKCSRFLSQQTFVAVVPGWDWRPVSLPVLQRSTRSAPSPEQERYRMRLCRIRQWSWTPRPVSR